MTRAHPGKCRACTEHHAVKHAALPALLNATRSDLCEVVNASVPWQALRLHRASRGEARGFTSVIKERSLASAAQQAALRLEGGLCPKPRERFVRAREKRSLHETSRVIQEFLYERCRVFFTSVIKERSMRRSNANDLYERYQGAIYAT